MADDPRLSADEVASRTFATSFRGYDANEVRSFLGHVADQLRSAVEREAALTTRLNEAEERAARPDIDEDTLLRMLGDETARVMKGAREAAADLKARAEESVEQILREAHDEAKRLRSAAESVLAERTAEAEAESAAIVDGAKAEADAVLAKARAEADALVEEAREQGKAMVGEAQAARERILADLTRRRRIAHVQVEQLRAGRDRLLEAYRMVRSTLDDVTDELQRAEAEARSAADVTARRLSDVAEFPLEDAEEGGAAGAGAAAAEVVEDGVVVATASVEPEAESSPAAASAGGSGPDEAAAPGGDLPVIDVEAVPEAPAASAAPAEAERAPVLVTTTVAAESPAPVTATPSRPASVPVEEQRVSSLRLVPRVPEPAAKPIADPEPIVDPDSGLEVVEPPASDEGVRILAPVASEVVEPQEKLAAADAVLQEGQARAAVEDLFARLRASREESVAHAREVLADPAGEATAAPAESAAATATADESTAVAAPEMAAAEKPVSDEDERCLQERDEAIADIESRLARKIKRSLQDEQNDVLDRLRSVKGTAYAGVLPSLDEHVARHVAVALPFLQQAGKGVDVETVARDLAESIVGPLRRSLEPALRPPTEDSELEPADRVGMAYREWKGDRIERLANDAVMTAWSRAAYAAVPEGTMLRWVVDDQGAACPDCDDNGLAGPTPKGEEYPTGQMHPPAHAGCRCLLVRAST